MKKILLIFIIMSISCEAKKTFSQKITENKFYSGSGMHTLELQFNNDFSYTAWYSSEGIDWYNSGVYKIENEKLNLTPKECKGSKEGLEIDCSLTLGKAVCTLEPESASYSHEYFLKCKSANNRKLLRDFPNQISDSLSLPLISSIYKEGVKINFQSILATTMAKKTGEITENAKLREKPSLKGKILNYWVNSYDGPMLEYLPKGTQVSIWLKTIQKEKINNWENHWYFVESGDSAGWVFGEFIKF